MVDLDYTSLEQYAEMLEELSFEMPAKVKDETVKIVKELRSKPNVEKLLKIQDDLESISNMNIDNFTRNEIINVVAEIDSIVNS